MVGSGLRIFNAYPKFARKGETFCCYPFDGPVPAWLGLSIVQVFMVLSVDPYSLRSMITGGHSERFSPIARNARPFQGLLPKPVAES